MRKTVKFLLWLLLTIATLTAWAQDGGRYVHTFLNLPISPRLASLGGKVPMLLDNPDPSLAVYNPANALETLHATATAAFTLYYGSVKYNHAAYFHHIGEFGMLGASIRQVWYGRMTRRNILGEEQGHFTAHDQALSIHYALPLNRGWRVGASLTPILSGIEHYLAIGLSMDLGLSYLSADQNISAALLCRNVGGSLKGYTPSAGGSTPLELQAGVSLGLGYAPVRFTLIMQNLENWKARFSSEDTRNRVEGNAQWHDQKETNWQALYREFFAHPIIGIELYPVRYVSFQMGYNHKRRTEMAVEAKPYLVGFSWGLGVQYKRLRIHFARSLYHLHGAANHISISYQFAEPSTFPTGVPADIHPHDNTIAL